MHAGAMPPVVDPDVLIHLNLRDGSSVSGRIIDASGDSIQLVRGGINRRISLNTLSEESLQRLGLQVGDPARVGSPLEPAEPSLSGGEATRDRLRESLKRHEDARNPYRVRGYDGCVPWYPVGLVFPGWTTTPCHTAPYHPAPAPVGGIHLEIKF
jgi:hypothetical protein